MNRTYNRKDGTWHSVPRTRGDEPQIFDYAQIDFPRSPHTRG